MNQQLKMLSGLFQSPSEAEIRIAELETQLNSDRACKEYAKIQQFIDSLVGDLNGKYEAYAFVRLYLRQMCYLGGEVAEEVGLPTNIATLLAAKCLPMVTWSIEDRAAKIAGNEEFMELLHKNSATKPFLSDEEVQKLSKELAELQDGLKHCDEDQEATDGYYDVPEKDKEAPQQVQNPDFNKKYGQLDPKNPFGLN